MTAEIRKIAVFVEEVRTEMGRDVSPPVRKAAAVAVIRNPFAGRYVEDLAPLVEIGAELGGLLAQRCVAALGILPSETESYGKSAMVGENGELEHAAALLHPAMGKPVREAVEGGGPPSSRRARNGAGPARCSTFRSATGTRPSSAPTSMGWRSR